MTASQSILFIDNVTPLSGKNMRPRERREIDILIESRKYQPYMVFTDPLLLSKPLQYLQTKTFSDNRVEAYRVPNLAVGSLSSNRSLGKVGKMMFGFSNLLFQSIYLLHLTALVLCLVLVKKIRLIHAHNPPDLTGIASLLVSKITRVPYIFEIHDRAPEFYCAEMGLADSSLVFSLMKIMEYLIIKNSKGVITVNQLTASYFKQYGGPTPTAIYTGTNLGSDEVGKTTQNRKLSRDPIILYQGTLNMATTGKPAFYDLELPIKAMPRILNNFPNAVLIYIGEGSGREKLEKRSKSMGLGGKVVFTGFLPQKQLFNWIRKAVVVLIPFSNNPNCQTTVPSKLYEYMAFGKPIVATRLSGISEILNHGYNGLLYKVSSVEDFASCVMQLLFNSKLSKRLSVNAQRDFFSKYSCEKNWPKLISLYDSILANNYFSNY